MELLAELFTLTAEGQTLTNPTVFFTSGASLHTEAIFLFQRLNFCCPNILF